MADASSTPKPAEPSGIAELPDQALVAAARTGDRDAFGTLWERHAAAGRRFAAATTRSFDADDLVAEAYVKIYTAVLAGKGPTGPFRPYLLVTIRNLAISWAKQRRDGRLEDADDIPDPRATDMAVLAEVDANLTVRAFRTLPERWQEVLWFTEVDGLPSADVAERLGMTVSGVGMLALRAREGLRQAWIQAHIDTSALGSEHQWVLQQIGQNARGKLRTRAKTKFDAHLAGCAACTAIAAEAVETSNHFTPTLVPLAVGILGAISLGAFLHNTPPAVAATAAAPAHNHNDTSERSRAAVGRRARVFLIASAVALVAVTGAAIGNAAIRTPATSPSALAPTGATSEPRPSASSATAAPSNAPTAIPGPESSTSAAPPTATPGTETKRTLPVTTPSDSAATPSDAAAPSDAASPAALAILPTITSADTAAGVLYPLVTGTARPGTSVTVSCGTGNPVTVKADAGGTWRVPELRIGAGSASITASGDDGSSAPKTVHVESPQVFASVDRTTVRITVVGAADTRYAVERDGATAGTVRTDTDGRTTVTLQNTAPDDPHTATVHASTGSRVGPATTVQIAAQS
ncbi:sigma-70 family RNA polymerase sigma factor [Curtobacterium sp. 1544]|uniref:RNA polymerase sigma factor n=1 Tax=Curtobacterium sp. 1544 TaxID=3156417 RepID=UPI0033970CCA